MIHQQQNPAQASSKASGKNKPKFRIEASIENRENLTGYERGNMNDYHVATTRTQARKHALNFWKSGYWVEVYDDQTGELLAGPINPDAAFPSYTV